MINILADQWKKAGVQEGDVLLVHSSLKRTIVSCLKSYNMRLTPTDILESFIKALGPTGTLLLPLFNFDYTKGVPFDIRKTPSHMGALTEAGRLHPRAVRTGHPIYSFAVIGFSDEKFKNINNYSGYGSDSPFAILREMNGKIGVLDLPDQKSMTFFHHVEEMHEVDYRYHKKFLGDYTDNKGLIERRTYGLFVRKLNDGVLTHVNPAGELLWKNGLYSGDRPGEASGLRVISAKKMYNFVAEIITSGKAKNTLYKIKEE